MQLVKQRSWFWDWPSLRASGLAAGTVLASLAPIRATIQEAGYGLGLGQGAIMKHLFVLPLAAFCTVAVARTEPIVAFDSGWNQDYAKNACLPFKEDVALKAEPGWVDCQTAMFDARELVRRLQLQIEN